MRKSITRGIMAVLLCTACFSCIEAVDVMAASSDEECICDVACLYDPDSDCPVCSEGIHTSLSDCKGEIVKHTVYFDVQGGECGNFTEEISENYYVISAKTKIMKKEGYLFGGWYRDPEYTDPWDVEHDLVEEDMTLYAKWIKKDGIGFDDDDDPDSSNTKVWSVTVYNTTARPNGNNEINIILDDEPAYPEASDIDIMLADDERYWMEDNWGNVSSEKYFATVEDLTSNDGGRTWTFTVRAADGTTTEEYTINVDITLVAEYCGHDSYEWEITVDDHIQKCTVCGKYNPDTCYYSAYNSKPSPEGHDFEVIRGHLIPDFSDEDGRNTLKICKECGAHVIEHMYDRLGDDILVTEGMDEEELLRIPRDIFDRNSSSYDHYDDQAINGSTQNTSGPNGLWFQDAIGWWFEKYEGGYPANSWYECRTSAGGNWYHFDASGYMQTGWFTDVDGNVYYLSTNQGSDLGRMYTGWNWIDGKCYYFNMNSGYAGYPAGALMRNMTTPDGFTVDATGAWTVNGVVQLQTQ